MTKYTSSNGYTGILYGESSLEILDHTGKEVMHTGFRTINGIAELKEYVDDYPNMRANVRKLYEDLSK